MNICINYKKSDRKSVQIKIKPDCSITVYAPYYVSDKQIDEFVSLKKHWIDKTIIEMKKRKYKKTTSSQYKCVKKLANKYLLNRANYISTTINLKPRSIKVTKANTRWGSCNNKGNICLSARLMFLPRHLIDYVIIHELCHLKYLNHSDKFYNEVSKYLPNYKKYIKELKNISINHL